MSSHVIRYSYVSTRARGMYSKFLKPDDYQLFLKSENLDDFEKCLRKFFSIGHPSARTAISAGATAQGADAIGLEAVVVGHFLDACRKIIRSLPKDEADFIVAMVLEYEILNIKTLLRDRLMGVSSQTIRGEMIDLGKISNLDWEELLETEDIQKVLKLLHKNPLGSRIEKLYLEKYSKGRSAFLLESRIDVEYLTWLYDKTEKFDTRESRLLKELLGRRLDALNVSWILRLKENFKMAPEEIMVELIPRGWYLNVARLKRLAFAEDSKMVFAILRMYPWRRYLPSDRVEIAAVEEGLGRWVKEFAYTMFRREPLQFAGVAAFVMLARAMAADVVRILETTEYHLSKEGIEQKLFFV